jgi:uridine kinase
VPPGTVLVVDSVFAFRPEYNEFWDYRIWLEVSPEMALARGIARDSALEGATAAARVHRDRYGAAESIYLAEVGPRSLADLVIDNSDFARPAVVTA